MAEGVQDIIIIGSGPAGWTAALYASRANLKVTVFEGPQPGGQLTTTTEVENYPGFEKGIQGPELMEIFKKQGTRFGAEVISEKITKVNFANKPFKVWAEDKEYQAKAIIISTGAEAKWLNLESETKYRGKGVSSCATCDGFFFKDKDILVVGGGDTAMEEAIFLTKFGKSVTVIHRRDQLRASKIMQDRAKKNSKIKFIYNAQLTEVLGDEKSVTGAKLTDTQTKEVTEVTCQGIFIAIGHKPNTAIFKDILNLDEAGYIKTEPGTVKTNIEGVFAAGDVIDKTYRQAITAAGMGCMAAMDAEKFLEE